MRSEANPVLDIQRETANWNHAMGMWMVQDVLTPGMKHAQEADLGTNMLWNGDDLQQRCCAGTKQKIVQDFLVASAARWVVPG